MNVWQRSVVDEAGNVMPLASVEVRDQVTSGLVQLYSDYAGASAIGNPIAADADGFVRFYADTGRYRIEATSGVVSRVWEDELLGLPAANIKYDRTEAEIAASVTPVSSQYQPGHSFRHMTAAQIADVSGFTGAVDVTTALQNCLLANDGASVVFGRGKYLTSGSLLVYSNVIEGGGSREDTVITPNGNFPCFVNAGHEFITGAIRRITIIYNAGVQPTSSVGNDEKIGIYWEIVSGRSPSYFDVEDVEVRGAWWAYYDESGSYGCNFSRFFGNECQNLFFKTAGTTFTLNQVIGLNCNKGIQLTNCLAFSLHACANDGAVITDGDSVNEFVSCTGIAINGWDSESNNVGGNGGCMFKFSDCTGVFSAHVGHVNDFSEAAGFVAMVICNDSFMEFIGHRPEYDTSADELTMTGSGTFYHFLAENGSKVTVTGGEFPTPTVVSGSPTLTPFIGTGTARVQVMGATYEGTKGANAFDVLQDAGTTTLTLTGCTTSPTGDARWSRNGNQVSIRFPQITATSNTTAATLTGSLPAQIYPAAAQTVHASIVDNTTAVVGLVTIGTGGSLTLLPSPNGGNFTASGTKGIFSCTVNYSLD